MPSYGSAGFSPGIYSGAKGLDQLGPKGPGAGNRYAPFLTGLIAVLGRHPEASQEGMGLLQQVMGNLSAQQQAQQAATAARRQGAGEFVTGYAMSEGATPEGLQAATEAAGNLYGLKAKGMERTAALGESLAPMVGGQTLDAEDRVAISSAIEQYRAGVGPETANVNGARKFVRAMFTGVADPGELDQVVTDIWYSLQYPSPGNQGLREQTEGQGGYNPGGGVYTPQGGGIGIEIPTGWLDFLQRQNPVSNLTGFLGGLGGSGRKWVP